jgi:small subunit ribosomal protein S1
MSENFAEMLEQSITQMNMRIGEIITGEVVDINRDVVIINAGLKSEGVIPREQFYNESGELEVAIGDIVEVALVMESHVFQERKLSVQEPGLV